MPAAATRPSVRPTIDPDPPRAWRVLLPSIPSGPDHVPPQKEGIPDGIPSPLISQADEIARKMGQIRKRDKLLAREYGVVWGAMLDAALNKTAAKQWIGTRYGYRPATVETYVRLVAVWDGCVRYWKERGVDWSLLSVQTFMQPSRTKRGSAPKATAESGPADGPVSEMPAASVALTPIGRQVLLLTALVCQHAGIALDDGKLRRRLPKLGTKEFAALIRDIEDWLRAAGRIR